jgi:hypothetical protein
MKVSDIMREMENYKNTAIKGMFKLRMEDDNDLFK